jgi:alpha-methylacyl-CoA racemase
MGPLSGVRVVELAALGPVPHAGMILADLGADVLRVERPGGNGMAELAGPVDHVLRGRRRVVLDLKSSGDVDQLLTLVDHADVLLEGFRPGVLERLGLAPHDLMARRPGLVVGRMTGWGSSGPLAAVAGHDLNYLALSGVLHALGPADQPPPVPLTLLGDYAGGSLFLVIGVLAALRQRDTSGVAQVVDAAMIDGIGVLAQKVWAMRGAGTWSDDRHANLLDGAAPFYDTYSCADGRFVAVAAIERRFYAELLSGLEINPSDLGDQYDRAAWPAIRRVIAAALMSRTRNEWADRFVDSDACLTPVLSFAEATEHPHARARQSFVEIDGVVQPAPAPRFGGASPTAPLSPDRPLSTIAEVLDTWSVR